MKRNPPYAPEISTIARQTPDARRAYWASLPPALRAILSHMVMWFRVYGSILGQGGAFQLMDAAAMIEAAQTRLHPALDRVKPGTALNARQMSMVTALYGFNRRFVPQQSPVKGFSRQQRLTRIRRIAARRFQQSCWSCGIWLFRVLFRDSCSVLAANFGHPVLQAVKPP